ncbi:sulfurtransferase [Xanthobacter autotrophicus]|uniref:sulfurtransferase n=1 Tax=Xanthobacter autotrophicus TaxID=280 RepID=UPI0024A71222|nr:sulfurtransferase [Xanthobacter autotrophicus]MDI4656235.1 sulfurtransferase [Xanthobacter autotrophicus]
MSTVLPGPLVSTEWLAEHLEAPDVKILDCTWLHESSNMDGRTQYRGRHLPGSVHFDIDHVADKSNPLPHMIPPAAEFAKKVGLLGIANGDKIVVYDRLCGGAAAARVWWMFRIFGYDDVAVLDGGYGKWVKEKKPSDMSPVRPEPKTFTATFNPALVRNLGDMLANVAGKADQVVDARGPAKFAGTQDDVFPVKKKGHIPGSVNLPWGDLIVEESGEMIQPDALAARFAAVGIDIAKPVVATCASGTISAVVLLALFILGNTTAALYDGSWAEWGLAEDTPAAAAA